MLCVRPACLFISICQSPPDHPSACPTEAAEWEHVRVCACVSRGRCWFPQLRYNSAVTQSPCEWSCCSLPALPPEWQRVCVRRVSLQKQDQFTVSTPGGWRQQQLRSHLYSRHTTPTIHILRCLRDSVWVCLCLSLYTLLWCNAGHTPLNLSLRSSCNSVSFIYGHLLGKKTKTNK